MGREDQVEEREVLESIFPDEITDISETEFRVKIVLDLPDDENADADADPDSAPAILLHVRYPENYPDEAPLLDLLTPQQQQGSSAAPSTHPHFSVAGDKDVLLSSLEETIQENLGIAMIFTLVTSLKDAAEQLVAERLAVKEQEREEVLLAAEREENKKFHGTPVTPETFLKWREGFLQEMEEAKQKREEERLAEMKKAKVKETVKMTGRQLWERGLAGKADADADEGDDEDGTGGMTERVEGLKVEAA